MDKVDDKQLVYIEAIISSMTKEERKDPELLNRSSSRRNRVARGSGRSSTEVNRLISMLEKQSKLMRRMAGMNPGSMENMSSNIASGNFQPKQSRAERRKNKK